MQEALLTYMEHAHSALCLRIDSTKTYTEDLKNDIITAAQAFFSSRGYADA